MENVGPPYPSAVVLCQQAQSNRVSQPRTVTFETESKQAFTPFKLIILSMILQEVTNSSTGSHKRVARAESSGSAAFHRLKQDLQRG